MTNSTISERDYPICWRLAAERLVGALLVAPLVMLVAALRFLSGPSFPPAGLWIIGGACGAVVLILFLVDFLPGLCYVRNFRFALGEDGVTVREQLVATRERFIPYARIQDVAVKADPVKRLLGIATVVVDEAGCGSLSPLRIRGLSPAHAQAVQRQILEHMRT